MEIWRCEGLASGQQVVANGCHGTLAQWQPAGLEELRIPNVDGVVVLSNVTQAKPDNLPHSESGTVNQDEHRVQRQRPHGGFGRGVASRAFEQALDLFLGKDVRSPPLAENFT